MAERADPENRDVRQIEGLPLATRNARDYAGFADHDGLFLVSE